MKPLPYYRYEGNGEYWRRAEDRHVLLVRILRVTVQVAGVLAAAGFIYLFFEVLDWVR